MTVIIIKLLLSIALMTLLIMAFDIHPAISMIFASLFMALLSGINLNDAVASFNTGFGSTMRSMAMCVFCGIIMARIMADSGMADVLAVAIVNAFPEKRAVLALLLTSFIISIPVFYDVNVIILLPIAFTICSKIGAPKSVGVYAVAGGAALSHSIIPPTPGPLSAISVVDGSVGLLIGIGTVICLIALLISYPITMKWIWPESSGNRGRFFTADDFNTPILVQQEDVDKWKGKKMPGVFASFLPLITPVLLILIGSVWKTIAGEIPDWMKFISDKGIALLIGCIISYIIALSSNMDRKELLKTSNTAINMAGNILIITAAGGAFGTVVTSTGIGDLLAEALTSSGGSVITVLLITAAIGFLMRLCTGSATASAVVVLTIMQPVVLAMGSVCNPIYFTIAGIAGAILITLPNSSGFWMVMNVSDMKMSGGLKWNCVVNVLPTAIVLILTLVSAVVFPLV